MENTSKISRLVYTWLALFLLWMGFTTSLASDELIVGFVLSFIVAALTYEYFTTSGLKSLTPKKIMYQIQYLFVFLVALVKSNLHVAKIVLTPSLPIHPGIVEFETKLKSDIGKMVLANSITLTPGTLTVDVIDNRFFIHWLEVETSDSQEAFKAIAEDFEKVLLKIYE
jgi:multicomponent Na+:H+ antiporter subunit E